MPWVWYGSTGTKSFAITVILWPSSVNFCIPSAPALINRSLCFLPAVNLNFESPLMLGQEVESGSEQLRLFRPLIRLFTEYGG